TWRAITRSWPLPSARAATMYSFSLMVRARLRARRTKFGMRAMPTATISFSSEPPSAVTMIRARSRVGKAISMSVQGMMAVPIGPPRTPATMPSGTPTQNPKTTEARPTSSETRAPQMMRLRRSRPNSSVPSRWPSASPGALSTAVANCSDGRKGARSGAAAATTTMIAARAMPTARGGERAGPGALAPAPTARSGMVASRMMAMAGLLSVGDARVDHGVEEVDREVDGDDDHREHRDGALGQRIVAGADGVDQHLAEAGAGEHRLGQHGAGEGHRDEQADDRQERHHHVAQGVLVDHPALGLPLGPRGADVVLADHLEHGRAGEPAHRGGQREAEGEGGQREVVQHVAHRGEEVP